MSVILETRDLEVRFGKVKAVDAVSLQVERGETLGIVGESGCGKTTFGKTVLGLQKANGGQIFYEGRRIDGLRGRQLLPYRRKMQMVFQDPYGSLDLRMSVYDIVKEGHELREKADGQERDPMLESLLQTVGLDPSFLYRYPGELSGGQRQRVGIARALAVDPALLVCDEPVSALDVSIRAQIVNMLKRLQEERKLTYLFISHDMSVVRYISDRIAIFYLGRLVELGRADAIFGSAAHPYTRMLLSCVPKPNPDQKIDFQELSLEGDSETREGDGCPFYPRCRERLERCQEESPGFLELETGHFCACFRCAIQP